MSSSKKPLQAFVSFPSPYTQTLLVKALVRTLSAVSITLIPPEEGDIPPELQWADYDLISWDHPRASPSDYLTSSYTYRKALIRKHQLHRSITEYLAKCEYRGNKSILSDGGYPTAWAIEIQFADELDEALLDDLYELAEVLRQNEELSEHQKSWYILKPGFADRAQGIRLFSTVDELQRIFESFEPPSNDEVDDEEEDGTVEARQGLERLKAGTESDEDEDDGGGTGVQTSQMRHFVIQEYAPSPVLFDIAQTPHSPVLDPTGYKFHLRAYVLMVGAYRVYLSDTMLALFSGSPYIHPTSASLGSYESPEEVDKNLRPHLTNTCLQTDAMGAPSVPEELVKLFWELEGLDALQLRREASSEYISRGRVDSDWLKTTFARAGEVIGESVKAGAECGSFGLQLVPNAFEIFGVDLLCSFSPVQAASANRLLPIPTVTLLEFNASPDFHQSGDRLQAELLEMFEGAIKIAVVPFFGCSTTDEEEETSEAMRSNSGPNMEPSGAMTGSLIQRVGESKRGWTLVAEAELRSFN